MALFSDVLTSDSVLILDNHLLAEDGVGGREGSFSMCTFWLVEALTRAGKYDKSFIAQAVLMFEDMITYSNHLGLYSEEITRSGEVCMCFCLANAVSRELSAGV
jgi:GH15 family glucan-1,4-alpha-glucosidase